MGREWDIIMTWTSKNAGETWEEWSRNWKYRDAREEVAEATNLDHVRVKITKNKIKEDGEIIELEVLFDAFCMD